MSDDTITRTLVLKIEHCCNCGIPFAMTDDFKERRLEDGNEFFCPAGHGQYYSRPKKLKNEIEKARTKAKRLEAKMLSYKEEVEHRRNQIRGFKSHNTRMKNAFARGECMYCGEQFTDLQEHLISRHPVFNQEEE